MEHLATIVFERTPAGAVAIKAAGNALPRQLRTLLLAIDGRSPVSQYVPFLTALAPLSDKFAQLEDLGFARRRAAMGVVAGVAATPSADRSPTPATQVSEAELRDFARQQFSPMAAPATPPDANDFTTELHALATHQDTTDVGNSPAGFTAPTPNPVPQQRVLASLLAQMQAYLSQAIGMEGLPVALMLGQITSLAQLRRELPSYQTLLVSYGADPAAHVQSLTQLLDQAA